MRKKWESKINVKFLKWSEKCLKSESTKKEQETC